jgi:hypothetical protein
MKWYRTADGNLRLWYEPDEIEQIAEDELRVANLLPTTAAPVTDLERFIEGRLKADLDLFAELPGDVLGLTQFDDDKRPRICINAYLSTAALEAERPAAGIVGRWRATLAHEASHVMLHRMLFVKDLAQDQLFEAPDVRESFDPLMRCLRRDVGYGRGPGDWREVQANAGLAALLMPRRVFRRLALSEGAQIVEAGADRDAELSRRLSERCAVSRQAASIRLSTLGLATASSAAAMFVSVE